jgi:dienelactone hydrolase
LVFLSAVLGVCLPARADEAYPQTFSVSRTYDNRPFEYRIEAREEKSSIVVYRLSYPSPVVSPVPQNNTIPGEYYLPRGIRSTDHGRPAVIVLHILNGNFELERMCSTMLAAHGIPAILFKLPYYAERAPPGGRAALADDPQRFSGALAQAVEDVRRTVDLLASRPEVDPRRIGTIGISLGGILAATAAGQEPRLARVMLVLAGGDLMELIRRAPEAGQLRAVLGQLPPHQRQSVERALRSVDPLSHAAALCDRARAGRVLLVNAAQDNTMPRVCTEKLAAALGIPDRVVWLEGLGHYTAMAAFPRILTMSVNFFGEDLGQGTGDRGQGIGNREQGTGDRAQRTGHRATSSVARPPNPEPRTLNPPPARVVLGVLQDMVAFGASEPAASRCHLADISWSATLSGGKPLSGRLMLARGQGGRFRVEFDVPGFARAAIGQDRFPWIASAAQTVFCGSAQDARRDPLALADPKMLMKLRVAAGAVAGLSLAPDMLEQVLTVTCQTPPGGPETLRLALHQRRGSARLVLQADGKTPQALEVDAQGVHGRLVFRAWRRNAAIPQGLFDPPGGRKTQQVDSAALYQMLAAMFNFGMESLP